ncbi:universal stress protein [Enhygromyxa salina]|uniref:universal stress protein n=1 Tax=Enhygromyxa salina TaxID=215803 RepID=UPI0015E5CEBA|nr:universal stress protein [Enhygromyxa salina]
MGGAARDTHDESLELLRFRPAVVAEHVLVTTDGSEPANRSVPMAVNAIRACGSPRVTLFRVLTCMEGARAPVHALEWELARAQADADLRQVAARFNGLHDRVETVMAVGRPAEQILNYVHSNKVDLLVMASHGSHDSRTWRMGSVARKVVAEIRTSVFITPPEADVSKLERVLLPLDCSARAECVLPLVAKLADVHDPEFVLAHVVPRLEIPHRLPAGGRDRELVDELTGRNRCRAEAYLQGVRDRLTRRGVRTKVELLSDVNPARAIERLANNSDVDLILMSAHGASCHEGESYGSFARRMLDSLVKPLWIVQDLPSSRPHSHQHSSGVRS